MRHALLRRRRGAAPDPTFITTWQTTSASESITLPLVSTGTYDFVVDWGDGSTDEITAHTDAARIHEYADAGEYEVRISGVCAQWSFGDVATSKDNILDVKNWGEFAVGVGSEAFRNCANLDVTASDAPDMTGVALVDSMFRQCPSLTGGSGFNLWDVSSVQDMGDVFHLSTFNADISGWDVSSVTDFNRCFFNNSSFNQNIGGWNVGVGGSPVSIFEMFDGATAFDQDIGGWNVSGAIFIGDIFAFSGLSTENYDSILIGWSEQSVPSDLLLGAGSVQYSSAAADARAVLTSAPNNWTITDGGEVT